MSVHSEEYKGWTIRIRRQSDPENPLKEFDCEPQLVLHYQADRRFTWTTDRKWFDRINGALDQLGGRMSAYGPRGALAIIERWLRAYWGIGKVVYVGAVDHGSVHVYLTQGEGTAIGDAAGWDSGWIGWFFWDPAHTKEWAEADEHLEGAFQAFESYVAGDVYGWSIEDPDGDEREAVWGFYGDGQWRENDGSVPYMLVEARAAVDAHLAATHSAHAALYRDLVNH